MTLLHQDLCEMPLALMLTYASLKLTSKDAATKDVILDNNVQYIATVATAATRGVARSKTVGWTEGASRTHGERGPRAEQSPLKLKAFCRWTTQTRGKI